MRRTWKTYLLTAAAFLVLAAVVGLVTSGPVIAQTIRAALVRDVDNPDRQEIYSKVFELSFPSGEISAEGCDENVPAGKRLILEHASARTVLPPGQAATAMVEIGEVIIVPAAYLPLIPQFTSSTNAWASGATPIRVRLAAGQRPCVAFSRGTSTGSGSAKAVLQGYLADAP